MASVALNEPVLSCPVDSEWLLMFLVFISSCSKSDSNNIVPLCPYHYICSVDFPILIE